MIKLKAQSEKCLMGVVGRRMKPHVTALLLLLAGGVGVQASAEDEEAQLPSPVEGIPLTGTLPVVYVNTADGAPIVSREDYLTAEMWIDPMGVEGVEAFGSQEEPVTLQIRGRGNSSWTGYGKKPYKLKLEKKGAPFGFPKSKHFALLAHAPTQSYFSGETAYQLSRLIGMAWTPRSYPVEVMLNGVNVGVYAFSESVRIDDGRIEIEEQPEGNTDEATIPYGWLVEIDNSDDTPQIRVPQTLVADDPEAQVSRFTIKTPEVLSAEQEAWITDQMTTLTHMILNPDKSNAEWAEMIDIESLAKYYIVQELSANFDAFVGSTYLYKGTGDKWVFGPLWDSEWTFVNDERVANFWDERVALTGVSKVNFTWIKDLVQFPQFHNEVVRVWNEFYPDTFNQIDDFIEQFYALTSEAYDNNNLIWPDYISLDIHVTYNRLKTILPVYGQWFDRMINQPLTSGIDEVAAGGVYAAEPAVWYTLQGVGLASKPTSPGIYIAVGADGSSRKVSIAAE